LKTKNSLLLTTSLVLSLYSSCAFATKSISQQQALNHQSSIEKGVNFGYTPNVNKKKLLNKKTTKQLLAQLVELNIKQLKVQKHIEALLQSQFDPKPKWITVNGKKCIQNSSDQCFRMPVINNIKKIPAIFNFYRHPSLANAKIKEQWLAKYTNNILNDVYLKEQAIRDLGPKYNLTRNSLGTIDINGMTDLARTEFYKSLVNKYDNRFQYIIFLGINHNLDMFTMTRLAFLVEDNPKLDIRLIFPSKGIYADWKKEYKDFSASKFLKKLPVYIKPSLFKKYKIYTSPSTFVYDAKTSKMTFILTGRFTGGDLYSSMIQYMIHNKIIKRGQLSGLDVWRSKSTDKIIKNYYTKFLGIPYEK